MKAHLITPLIAALALAFSPPPAAAAGEPAPDPPAGARADDPKTTGQPVPDYDKLLAASKALRILLERHPESADKIVVAMEGTAHAIQYAQASDKWQRRAADLIVRLRDTLGKVTAAWKAGRP